MMRRLDDSRASGPLDHDERAVVGEVSGEGTAILDRRGRDLGRGQFERRSNDLRQPLEPVELAVTPRLHDAVRVDDDRAARIDPRVALLVRLTGLDAECEPPDVELVDGAVR